MAKKHMQELTDMSTAELVVEVDRLRDELFHLRHKNAMRTLDNPVRIRSVRRQIARAETLLTKQHQQSQKEKA